MSISLQCLLSVTASSMPHETLSHAPTPTCFRSSLLPSPSVCPCMSTPSIHPLPSKLSFETNHLQDLVVLPHWHLTDDFRFHFYQTPSISRLFFFFHMPQSGIKLTYDWFVFVRDVPHWESYYMPLKVKWKISTKDSQNVCLCMQREFGFYLCT